MLVLDAIMTVACQLMTDKKIKSEEGNFPCQPDVYDKALLLSQQLLYSIAGAKSLLTVGTAFTVYIDLPSKSTM